MRPHELIFDDQYHRLLGVAQTRSAVGWLDCARLLEEFAEQCIDVEEIRLANAERRLVEAAAAYRKVHAEVTS